MTLTPSPPEPATDPGTITLIGHGSTVTAEELRSRLVAASDAAEGTAIDASELLSVGQAVLQLLIAARQEADLRNQRFHFTGASTEFSERVQGCQLADAIGLEIRKDVSL